jgi:hypothetical protein
MSNMELVRYLNTGLGVMRCLLVREWRERESTVSALDVIIQARVRADQAVPQDVPVLSKQVS